MLVETMKVITKDIDKHDCEMSDAVYYKGRTIELALRRKDYFLSVWITDVDIGSMWVSGVDVTETKRMVTLKRGADHLTLNVKKQQLYYRHVHNLVNIAKGVIDALDTANDVNKSYQ